jgi:hypothetical protein
MAAEQIQSDDEQIQYSLMPQDLEMKIMERLPLECCCRFRSVCKGWNDFLSSTHFIRVIGSESATSSRQPWLLLCTPKMEMPCLLYSFFTNSWRTISLSFLLHHKDLCGQLNYRGSASGMLLLDIRPFCRWGNLAALPKLCVCNPLNRTVFSLPQMPCVIRVMATGIVPGDEFGSYVVLVIGMKTTSNSVVTVESYDSLSKSWSTSGTLPDNLGLKYDSVIFCKGSFYCLTSSHHHDNDDGHVVEYNMKEGNATIIPMPATDKNDHYWPRLLSCRGGSDVLIVGAIEEDHMLKDLVIWQYTLLIKTRSVIVGRRLGECLQQCATSLGEAPGRTGSNAVAWVSTYASEHMRVRKL